MNKPTMLQRVQAKMANLQGQALFELEEVVGMSYDTLLRIRQNKVDPAFSKVQRLAEHFRIVRK